MKITLELVGILQGKSARRIREIELDVPTKIQSFIRELVKIQRDLPSPLFSDNRNIESNLLILVNEKDIYLENGLETILNPGDKVTLIPISHGG